jgi:hypothetical protein
MATPLINGLATVWADITVSFLGVPLTGVRGVEFNVKQEITNNYGAGTDPVSRGFGRRTFEGSLTVLAEEWRNIKAAAPNNDPTKIPMFDLQILYINSAGLYEKAVLKAVNITENNFSSKEGDTMIEITVPFVYAGLETSI